MKEAQDRAKTGPMALAFGVNRLRGGSNERKTIMPGKIVDVTSRHFNPTSAPGLTDEARRAVNAAFDAMSAWRTETVNNSEKSFEQIVDKMAAAARAMGWPDQIVDATRTQMQAITKMQVEVMDYLMDAWEGEIKSPSRSPAMLSKLKSGARRCDAP